MKPQSKRPNKGILIFLGLLLAFLCISLVAYVLTGNEGIEERFLGAVGGEGHEGEEHEHEHNGGFLGFMIEGNIILYALILAILLVVCLMAFKLIKP